MKKLNIISFLITVVFMYISMSFISSDIYWVDDINNVRIFVKYALSLIIFVILSHFYICELIKNNKL